MRKFLKNILTKKPSFESIGRLEKIYLYAGDVPQNGNYKKFIGLSLKRNDIQHICHDIRRPLPLDDGLVDIYQAEDVFEHIEKVKIPGIIDEIYRVLKPGGIFRLSVPDYQCDVLQERSIKNSRGDIIFDPLGGGRLVNGEVVDGGHIWFPDYMSVKGILNISKFRKVDFLHYYNETGEAVTNEIDYSIGYISRTPDNDDRVKNPYRPMSIVVDCFK